jgi:hypothetical protein
MHKCGPNLAKIRDLMRTDYSPPRAWETERETLVAGARARGRELALELVVQVGGAGMPVTGGQEAQQGHALRRQPVFLLPESGHQFLKPGLWIDHGLAALLLVSRESQSL